MRNAIIWPDDRSPRDSVNFISEELVVPGLCANDVWPHLVGTSRWESFYGYMSGIVIRSGGPTLAPGSRFCLTTLTFAIEAEVTVCEPPSDGAPGRLCWHGLVEEPGGRLDLHHAWLLEDLPDDEGVRILTEEIQDGELAHQIAAKQPNPILYAHQDWVKGLAATAIRARQGHPTRA